MIKIADMKDLDSVTALAALLWPNHPQLELKNELRELLQNKSAMLALFLNDTTPVGFAQCQLRHDYVEGTESSPVSYLEGIFVKDKYRKRGIAKELLLYCEAWAKQNGCVEFGSDCELDNVESLRFHLNVGFAEANRIICFSKRL